ncbi:MAG: hypothetical protein Q6363_001050, partial [Candidatus Njordarchaeota archaeon]
MNKIDMTLLVKRLGLGKPLKIFMGNIVGYSKLILSDDRIDILINDKLLFYADGCVIRNLLIAKVIDSISSFSKQNVVVEFLDKNKLFRSFRVIDFDSKDDLYRYVTNILSLFAEWFIYRFYPSYLSLNFLS